MMNGLLLTDPSRYVQAPSGLIIPKGVAEEQIRQRRPRGMEFFAGAGGMALGMIQAGVEVVAVSEWNIPAVVTIMANLCRYGQCTMHYIEPADEERMNAYLIREYRKEGHKTQGNYVTPTNPFAKGKLSAGSGWISTQPASVPGVSHVFIGDMRKLTSQRILKVLGMKAGELDIVSGGPPCQGYSKAGKQNVMDPRNSLVFEFARMICELKPKSMMMEEVPEIMSMVTPDGHNVVDQFTRILSDGGFGGHDAFQKSIAAQAGTMGLVRGKGTIKDRAGAKVGKPAAPVAPAGQRDMFDEAT